MLIAMVGKMKPEKVQHDDISEYRLNGKLHREDGPAVEYVDGSKEWWFNGKLHREDGPAVEYVDGSKEWWFNGKQFTKWEFEMLMFVCEMSK